MTKNRKKIKVGDNKWHHNAIVFENDKVCYYIDGKKTNITIDWWEKNTKKEI